MRKALAALVVVVLIAVGAWAYTRPAAPAAAPSPSPTATATAAAVASPTAAASPTASASPTPSPTATATVFGRPVTTGAVTVRTAPARLSDDFRYVATRESTGRTHWIVLLDLAGRRAHYVAEIEIRVPAGSEATPEIAVSPSADGRALLLAASAPDGPTQLFHVAVEGGLVRHLRELDQFSAVALSPDGSRFAFTDASQEASRHGLWVDTIAGGASRRLIASSPLRSSGPARPAAFSTDGTQLAAVVTFGPGDSAIAIVATAGAEARIIDQGRAVEGATLLERGSLFDWAGAPADAWAWNAPSESGGSNAVDSYDVRTAQRTLVYQPAGAQVLRQVDRHPDLDRFVTQEHEGVQGAGAIWVRTRQGGATKVADVGEGGPRLPWWSPDGSRLYALRGEDDSVGTVVDVLTGEVIVDYCIRNAGPGCV